MTTESIAAKAKLVELVYHRLGFFHAFRFKCLQWLSRAVRRSLLLPLRSPLSRTPLWIRSRTSDPKVFHQIFIEEQYGCIPEDFAPDLIIDAGCNIGLAAVYLLNRFPQARLVAIEPEPQNLEIARKNLAPYVGRSELVAGAVWSQNIKLKISRGGPFEAWAVKTEEPDADDPGDITAFTIPDLIKMEPPPPLSPPKKILLKMDVEGAEIDIFGDAADVAWIDEVGMIAIELHGEQAESIFLNRIKGRFSSSKEGETWICERI